jgi:hypothetical protein
MRSARSPRPSHSMRRVLELTPTYADPVLGLQPRLGAPVSRYAVSPRPLRVCTDGHQESASAKGVPSRGCRREHSLSPYLPPVPRRARRASPSSANEDAALAPLSRSGPAADPCSALTLAGWSGRIEARTGLRMMPTFPRSPLSFRTAGFPQYGWKAGLSGGTFPCANQLKPAPGIRRPTYGLSSPFVHLVASSLAPH